jgi:hypothetical protein
MNELIIPPAVFDDPNAFEILRVWAAHEQEHVNIHSGLNGGAYEFGGMLGKLAKHGMNLYSQPFSKSNKETMQKIIDGFENEISSASDDVQGEILN